VKIPGWLRWQITLRWLLVLLTAGCLALGFVVDRVHRHERALAAIEGVEGSYAVFDFGLDADGFQNEPEPPAQPPAWLLAAPLWLQRGLDPAVSAYYSTLAGAHFERAPTEAAWQALEALPRVRVLGLSGDWVDDQTLQRVLKLRGLQSLQIGSRNVTGAGLERLAEQPQLREVALDCPQVRSESLSFLAGLPRLKRLRIHQPPLPLAVMKQLASCPELEQLHLNGPHLTAETAAVLPSLRRLRMLHLQESPPAEIYELLHEARRKLPDLCLSSSHQTPTGGYATSLPSINTQQAGAIPRRGQW
jgi:hypothetical protein